MTETTEGEGRPCECDYCNWTFSHPEFKKHHENLVHGANHDV